MAANVTLVRHDGLASPVLTPFVSYQPRISTQRHSDAKQHDSKDDDDDAANKKARRGEDVGSVAKTRTTDWPLHAAAAPRPPPPPPPARPSGTCPLTWCCHRKGCRHIYLTSSFSIFTHFPGLLPVSPFLLLLRFLPLPPSSPQPADVCFCCPRRAQGAVLR